MSVSVISESPNSQPQARLLITDAAAAERVLVAENLRRKGYAVDEACSGSEALESLENKSYEMIVLEIALPGLSGVEVMRQARETQRDLLIVVLTAHATVESAIAAVKLNVVDYILKPCKIEDLALTIARALDERAQQLHHQHLLNLVGEAMDSLRQSKPTSEPPALSMVDAFPARVKEPTRESLLTIDHQKRRATLNTNPPHTVELTEGEFSILATLMEKPDQVLSYNDLARTALGYNGMDKWTVESVIRSTVFRLRHKIEPGPNTPCLIHTVRGRGYFFSPA